MPTTFTDAEMRALKTVVDFAASRCGGGEDTIGCLVYTGAIRHLDVAAKTADGAFRMVRNDAPIVELAMKIDGVSDPAVMGESPESPTRPTGGLATR